LDANSENPMGIQPNLRPARKRSSPLRVRLAMRSPM